jgi:hypothetical protein
MTKLVVFADRVPALVAAAGERASYAHYAGPIPGWRRNQLPSMSCRLIWLMKRRGRAMMNSERQALRSIC